MDKELKNLEAALAERRAANATPAPEPAKGKAKGKGKGKAKQRPEPLVNSFYRGLRMGPARTHTKDLARPDPVLDLIAMLKKWGVG